MDYELLELMPSTVKISTRTSHTNYGEPVYANTTTKYRARIVAEPDFYRTAHQEVVDIKTTVWVNSTKSIDAKDRVTLPDGSTPPIIVTRSYTDQLGVYMVKLSLGW